MHAFNTNNCEQNRSPIPLNANTPLPVSFNNNNNTNNNNNSNKKYAISPISPINPFGSGSLTPNNNNNNNNTNTIMSQQSLLSPITPTTPITSVDNNNSNNSNSPLYNSNYNDNNNSNAILCDECDESDRDGTEIHRIQFSLIVPNGLNTPKYQWRTTITSFNGALSCDYIRRINNAIQSTNTPIQTRDRMEFMVDATNETLAYLLPFPDNQCTNNSNSSPMITSNQPMNTNIINSNTDQKNKNKNKNKKTQRNKTNPLIVKRKEKKKYKYNDPNPEAGYCDICDKQFKGYRGLTTHRNAKHTKVSRKNNNNNNTNNNTSNNSNSHMSENEISESESDSDSDSDSDESSNSFLLSTTSNTSNTSNASSSVIRLRKRKFSHTNAEINANRNRRNIKNTNKKRRLDPPDTSDCGDMDFSDCEPTMEPIGRNTTPTTPTTHTKYDPQIEEKRKLFQICVDNKVRHLLGNTQLSNAPYGLHKTPNKWCRYCGSRLTSRWYEKGRICCKHRSEYKKNEQHLKIFANGNGKDLLQTPFKPSTNTEFWYLKQLVKKLTTKEEEDEYEDEEDMDDDIDDGDDDYDVKQIHSRCEIMDTNKRLVYYLVEWEGYAMSASTYEPESEMECDKILKRFEKKIQSSQMMDCVKCKLGGFDCRTKPCFVHHFDSKQYEAFFKDYHRTNIRQLAQIKKLVSGGDIKSYCDKNGYKFMGC